MARRGRSGNRLVLATLGVVGVLVFAGCDWTMFGYDAALTHSSPDTAINSANVSTVRQLFTFTSSSSGEFGSPVESNGVVYIGAFSGGLYAFDANGAINCSGTPNQCSPLWTGSTAGSDPTTAPAVANGVVYIVSANGGTLSAFDANGITGCSGTPKLCQPLWTAPTTLGADSSVVVVNGVVYIGADGTGNGGRVEAFDANGVTNCSGVPKTCQPLWTSSSNIGFSSPAVANGVVFTTGEDDKLYAFSANGTTGCSGTPTTCSPLWTDGVGTGTTDLGPASPTVSNGVVYYEDSSNLNAFDAGGVTNCSGTPKTCTPLWTAVGAGLFSSPAVANGIVYAPTGPGLDAYDANGVTNCSGTPKTCAPLWTYDVNIDGSSPSLANGLVFVGQFTSGLEAFDARGVTNCSGTPKVCNSLWTGPAREFVTGSPAIANGKVYVTDNAILDGFGDLYAWVLPPPTTRIALPSNDATVSGGQYLDASASPGVTQVRYELTGRTLNHSVIGTATPTYVGWLAGWDTTTVPNGTYTLESVASYGGEISGTSAPVTITVNN